MNSWWDLGEHGDYRGNELAIYQIQCPFCHKEGKFETAFHAEKKKANSDKALNFDTLKCANCAGFVMVLWSATEHGFGTHGIHDYCVLPYPIRVNSAPDYWPEEVQRYWIQAQRNLQDENSDAAALIPRSALQATLREKQARGKTLKDEIHDLASQGILPPLMRDWSDNVRELGNVPAHPEPGQPATAREDARDVVEFLNFLLEYLYTLPKGIDDYRSRRHNP